MEGTWGRVTGSRPSSQVPPAGTGLLLTMLALATHAGVCVLVLELALCQVGEADADGGQGLRVVRLHDVAQEPYPELLEWGRRKGPRPSWGYPMAIQDWSGSMHSLGASQPPQSWPPTGSAYTDSCQPSLCQEGLGGIHPAGAVIYPASLIPVLHPTHCLCLRPFPDPKSSGVAWLGR